MRKVKSVISILLILALTLTMMPTGYESNAVEVNAAVSGIINGGTYKIVSAYNGKAITQTDLSSYYADCVVWNTDAMSDLARWQVKESGDYYTFTNIVSGKSIKIDGSSANGSNVDLNGNDNSNNYKWKLVPITSGDYAGCFYIVSAVTNSDGEEECAEIISDEDKKDTDGATVRLWTKAKSVEYEPRQIWRFEQSDAENITFTEAMSDEALAAFKNKYFVYDSSTGYNSLGGGFWGVAEVMESMLDGYETTGKSAYKEMFEGTYNAFIKRNGDYWTSNEYNDDIAWAVLDSVRAYLLFGNQTYLDIAKNNYDFMYSRGLRDDGLIIWKMNSDGGTTSCINGPATVAACYLAIATGDDSYYTKAKNIFDAWRNSGMYVSEGSDAGHVWDTTSNNWRSTYNQGTFIGAATMLYERYGDEQYRTDAYNAMENTMNLCNNLNGMYILKEENTNSGDLSGMRGILMRYMRRFIVTFDAQEYLSFFQDNAKIAWMNRNSSGIMQCSWQKKAAEDATWDSFAAYNAISLMANIPTYSDSLERDAYSIIEAEDMDYTMGLISEDSTGTSGGRSLGGIKDGYYTAYYNIDFGTTGASKVKIKYSRKTQTAGASGTVEFRLGSTTGPLIAKATLDDTGTWNDWKEITVDTARITGVQNVYAVFHTSTDNVCNLDYFTFESATKDNQGYLVLKSDSNDKYVQCKSGSSDTTWAAQSDNRDDWEEMMVVINTDGTVSFKSLISGKYARAVNGDSGYYITANADSISDETKFIIERFAADTSESQQVAIKSVASGKYLAVDPDGDLSVMATSDSVGGAWETFHFETVNGEWIVPEGSTLIAGSYVDAYSQIQALSYSSQNGIVNDPSNIGGTHNGDWAAYNNVDFGEVSPATVKISYARNNSSCDGDGYVDVILDDINNSAAASVKLPSTAPNSWSNYIDIEGEVTGTVTGVHTVYLKFRGGSGNVANVSSFTFKQSSGIRDAFSTIEAESHDAYDGIIDYTTPVGYVGNTNADEWVRYDSVKFTETAKAVTFKYACNSSNAAGNVYIYLDGMENNPVGIVHFDPTAADWNNYVELKANLSEDITEGTHSVYFKFVPDDGKTYVANFDWFVFNTEEYVEPTTAPETTTPENQKPIEVEGLVVNKVEGNNVTFAWGQSQEQVSMSYQYNVYIDNVLYNTYTGAQTIDYSFESDGEHTITVKAMYNGVESQGVSVNVTIETEGAIKISGDIKVEGYQISTALGGNRVVGSVEPEINGQIVKNWGFVYGLSSANGKDFGITDNDMYVGSESAYVKSYQSTSAGTADVKMGDSATATYFVRTMLFASETAEAFNAKYKVRAYAVLEDDSIVYSSVSDYSIFDIASYLYENILMNTHDAHQYLYNKVLKIVDSNYEEVDYNWGNTIVRPDTYIE